MTRRAAAAAPTGTVRGAKTQECVTVTARGRAGVREMQMADGDVRRADLRPRSKTWRADGTKAETDDG